MMAPIRAVSNLSAYNSLAEFTGENMRARVRFYAASSPPHHVAVSGAILIFMSRIREGSLCPALPDQRTDVINLFPTFLSSRETEFTLKTVDRPET
jgi:hypothetical protein